MKNIRRILSVFVLATALVPLVASCAAPAGTSLLSSAQSSVTQLKNASAKKKKTKKTPAGKNKQKKSPTVQQQKELLDRLVESNAITQQRADEIKGYLQKNAAITAIPAKWEKADFVNNNAALVKLSELITNKETQRNVSAAVENYLWDACQNTPQDIAYDPPLETRLTHSVLKLMVREKAISQEEMDRIVIQQCRDALSGCLETKSISQADYDAVKLLLDNAEAVG